MGKLEDFLFNQIAGKIIARAFVTLAGFVMGPEIQTAAQSAGITISVDPSQFAEFGVLAGHAIYELFKSWRTKEKPSA